MKKIILPIIFCLLLGGCSMPPRSDTQPISSAADSGVQRDIVKAVWMAYYELGEMTKGHDERAFTEEMQKAMQLLKQYRMNTLIVQVRPCADAFYRSSLFPVSVYFNGKQGGEMTYDPLAIICRLGKENGIAIEAWINPYRVSQNADMDALSDDSIAKKWHKSKKKKHNVYIADKIYFNPASEEVTGLIVDGVTEIVNHYPVSGIQFDDYFYPTQKKEIDSEAYQKYCADGGTMRLPDFRRDCVSRMIKAVYKAVKNADKSIRFGVSPSADVKRNYGQLYADTQAWASKKGYVDYIAPQVYFGFLNETQPFMRTVRRWTAFTACDLYIGLPLYKAGKEDKYASLNDSTAINEFKNNSNILARQIRYLLQLDEVKGICIFSYGCLKDARCSEEAANMLAALPDG